jgi:acyl-CoA thioesterase
MKVENDFTKNNHYELVSQEENKVVLKAEITETAMNFYGICHGAFVFGLGDTAMGIAAYNTGKKAITLTSNISYLKAGKGKFLTAEGILTKVGKNICFAEAKIYDDEKNLIATMTGNYYFID